MIVNIVLALCHISTEVNQQLKIYEMKEGISFSMNENGKIKISKNQEEQYANFVQIAFLNYLF